MATAVGERERGRRVVVSLAVVLAALIPAETALGYDAAVTAPLMVVVCLVPWRRLVGLDPVAPDSTPGAWRILGIGMAMASASTALLSVLDAAPIALMAVPVLATLPATLRGAWGALVRGISATTSVDVAIISLAVLLLSWSWVVDDFAGMVIGEVAVTLVLLGLIAALAGAVLTNAARDPRPRAELVVFALALLAFGVALVEPSGGPSEAYRTAELSTGIGYGLAALAVVRGQLSGERSARVAEEALGGTGVAALLVVGSFLGNGVVTGLRDIPPHPLEGALKALLLLTVATRVVMMARAWRRIHTDLDHLATTDPLTGLRNRAQLVRRLEAILAGGGAAAGVSVLLIDVDRFKVINDSLGHQVGDRVLVAVADRLRAVAGSDAVFRFGGDEFVVVVPRDAGDPSAYGERIRAALAATIAVDGRDLQVSGSVGVATATAAVEPTALIRDADIALYRAKELGRDRVVCFDSSLHAAALRRLAIESGLRAAHVDGSLSVCYQPVVSARTGDLVAAEVLLRWTSASLGPVGPGEFIEVAEDIGAIVPIGSWVITQACADLAAFDAALGCGAVPHLTVNVSAVQLLVPGLLDHIRDQLAVHGLTPDRLVVEVTESALLDPSGPAAQALFELSRAGIRLAVDDFGTGYSALSYLETFPVSVLKVDRSFVTPLDAPTPDGAPRRSMIPTLVRLARMSRLLLVAEGVETPAQRDALLAMGCVLHQGYLYSRPVPADVLVADWGRVEVA
ncbi:putative bifunctional diguanylate cyclase/phosphodiesterase [Euzebya sp.]|uniref:putative bifunctional diguanylate cyclase/phosphodiesterase n=1 Tax=Euzebya sp. TaxID=1971409 RepID=UPI0035150831